MRDKNPSSTRIKFYLVQSSFEKVSRNKYFPKTSNEISIINFIHVQIHLFERWCGKSMLHGTFPFYILRSEGFEFHLAGQLSEVTRQKLWSSLERSLKELENNYAEILKMEC